MGKFIDIVGNRYGKWMVLHAGRREGARYFWFCRCDCGKEKEVNGYSLRHGISKSCGGYNCVNRDRGKWTFVDLVGNRYGRLLVLEKTINNARGKIQWMCQCDCGNIAVVVGESLKRGYTKSCGCIMKERTLPHGKAAFNAILKRMKNGAKQRGHKWFISDELAEEIMNKNCFYCGSEPTQFYNDKSLNGTYIYNGIDRVNSNMEYVDGNVVACCKSCNFAKRTMSVEQFREWIIRVYEHFVRDYK